MEFKNIYNTDKWMIPYIGIENSKKYSHGSGKKVLMSCPYCGRERLYDIHKLYNQRYMPCYCRDTISYPNKIAYELLKQLDVNFESEKTFPWSKINYEGKTRKCRYDFYFIVKEKEYLLEMDGKQHKNCRNTGQWIPTENQKYIDNEKDVIAKKHGIEVIRIDCEKSDIEFIKSNILSSKLNDVLNLDNIDWNKCNEFAVGNIVKEICNYKKENPRLTTSDISKIVKLHMTTVARYLKIGMQLGWCIYNPKEERVNNAQKAWNKNSKKVYQYDLDYKLINIWDSVGECRRNGFLHVSECCKDKTKTCKGYRWSYELL